MHIIKLAALGVLAMGISTQAAYSVNTGLAAQVSSVDNPDYNTGVGLNGFIQGDRLMGAGIGSMGLRANFDNFQAKGGTGGNDIQEGGLALTATAGVASPSTRFTSGLGGHVGYARREAANFLDLGPDLTAAYRVTPRLGLHALVTPSWFINQDKSDYLGTKFGLGVAWKVPGA
jgi:hypothetical protein